MSARLGFDTEKLAARVSATLGACALAGSAATLLGWALEVPRLTDWFDTGISMQPNTAVGVGCAGLALILFAARRGKIAFWLALLTALIGAATLVEHAAEIDLGIDTLLFDRPWGSRATAAPGRMGPPAATSFVLLGLGIVAISAGARGRLRTSVPWLGFATACIALLAAVGYVFGADPLFTVPRLSGIASQTATLLLALGVGLMVAVPDRQPVRTLLANSAAGLLARRSLPFIVVIPVLLGWLRLKGQEAGLYDTGMGTALFVLVLILLLCAMLAWGIASVGARERAVASAREASMRADMILNTSRDQFALLDREWRCLYVNQRMIEVTGASASNATGRTFWEFWPDTLGTELETAARRVMERREADALEYFYAPWKRWFDLRISPTVEGGIALFILEITQRKQAESALQSSERELTDFFETAALGLHWVGPDGTVLRANQADMDLLGYERDEYVGRNIVEFHVDRAVIDDILQRLAAGETLRDHPARLRAKDGSIKEVLIDSSVMWEEGRFIHTRCFTRDVTARKRAEEAVLDRERQLQLLTDLAPVLIARCDGERRYRFANASYARRFGFRTDEVVGKHMSEVLGEAAYATARPHVDAVLAGQRVEYEMSLSAQEPHAAQVLRTAYEPELDASGRVVGFVLASVDITDRKVAEAALREADQRKDEFLATLAHELRNPLTPVRNSLEIMKRAQGDAAMVEQARSTMERQVEHMVRLIEDLLDVSRITRNKLDLRKAHVELASILHHAVETCRPMAESARHELIVSIDPEPIYLDADSVRLAQVFGNLLTNACKYTERGGRIQLLVERQEGDVLVTVRDTGVGIPPEMLPRVFDMFAQVDRPLERSQGGLGIGLALVKRLVELHQGTVTARSAGQGQGSEFEVRLPVLAGRPTPPADELAPRPLSATSTKVRRVLVVDDNRDAARSLATLLTMAGIATRTAHDGAEAIAAAASFDPDLILLDLGMPKMNGYDACRAIRELPRGKDIVVLALTGWGQDEARRRSKEAGFDGHLVKPVDQAALTAWLQDASQPSS